VWDVRCVGGVSIGHVAGCKFLLVCVCVVGR